MFGSGSSDIGEDTSSGWGGFSDALGGFGEMMGGIADAVGDMFGGWGGDETASTGESGSFADSWGDYGSSLGASIDSSLSGFSVSSGSDTPSDAMASIGGDASGWGASSAFGGLGEYGDGLSGFSGGVNDSIGNGWGGSQDGASASSATAAASDSSSSSSALGAVGDALSDAFGSVFGGVADTIGDAYDAAAGVASGLFGGTGGVNASSPGSATEDTSLAGAFDGLMDTVGGFLGSAGQAISEYASTKAEAATLAEPGWSNEIAARGDLLGWGSYDVPGTASSAPGLQEALDAIDASSLMGLFGPATAAPEAFDATFDPDMDLTGAVIAMVEATPTAASLNAALTSPEPVAAWSEATLAQVMEALETDDLRQARDEWANAIGMTADLAKAGAMTAAAALTTYGVKGAYDILDKASPFHNHAMHAMKFSNAPISTQAITAARANSVLANFVFSTPTGPITHASQVHNPAMWSYSPHAQSTAALAKFAGWADGFAGLGRTAGAIGLFAEPIASAITGYSEAGHLSREDRVAEAVMSGLKQFDNAAWAAGGAAVGGVFGAGLAGAPTAGWGALPGAVAGGAAVSMAASELYANSYVDNLYNQSVTMLEPAVATAVPYGLAAYDWAEPKVSMVVGWVDDLGDRLSEWWGD